MTVLVHFSGPSYSKTVVLEPGGAAVEVGRDPEAAIHLPDNDRLISRRHVAMEWCDGGVRVSVLSRFNGLATPRGEFSIGQTVVLAPGESGQLGRYSFVVERGSAVAAAPPAVLDAALDAMNSRPGTGAAGPSVATSSSVQAVPLPSMPPAMPPAPAQAAAAQPGAGKSDDPWGNLDEWAPSAKGRPAVQPPSAASLNHAFDDAFSSSTAWRVEDMPPVDPLASGTFEDDPALGAAFSVPDQPATAAPAARRHDEAALRALCKGLRISAPSQLGDKDWEQLGRSIRQVVQGLADLVHVRAELKMQLRAADRTLLAAPENNPLKSGVPLEELLHYLLFMPQGTAGYMPVKKALDEAITDLRAHELATLAAVRAVVQGSIQEFEPASLRTSLMKDKRSFTSMVDNARLWDLYTAHYQQKGEHMADWLEQMFNRHFMPAYSREAERLREESQPQPPVGPGRA